MALASAASRVGRGAKIADFWRFSADFDPISEGTQPRAKCCRNTGFFSGGGSAGPGASGHGPWSRFGDCGPGASAG